MYPGGHFVGTQMGAVPTKVHPAGGFSRKAKLEPALGGQRLPTLRNGAHRKRAVLLTSDTFMPWGTDRLNPV